MKKVFFNYRSVLLLLSFMAIVGMTQTGCRTKKEGCGLEDQYAPPTDRRGNLTTKSGDSNLFGKKMRKRSGR